MAAMTEISAGPEPVVVAKVTTVGYLDQDGKGG